MFGAVSLEWDFRESVPLAFGRLGPDSFANTLERPRRMGVPPPPPPLEQNLGRVEGPALAGPSLNRGCSRLPFFSSSKGQPQRWPPTRLI